MISLIESNTTALLGLALEATSIRHQAIAHNIANANTPGYRPIAVRFGDLMTEAGNSLSQGRKVPGTALTNARPLLGTAMAEETGADGVSLDVEVAQLSANALHHQTLLKALNRHFSIIGTAISEGKR